MIFFVRIVKAHQKLTAKHIISLFSFCFFSVLVIYFLPCTTSSYAEVTCAAHSDEYHQKIHSHSHSHSHSDSRRQQTKQSFNNCYLSICCWRFVNYYLSPYHVHEVTTMKQTEWIAASHKTGDYRICKCMQTYTQMLGLLGYYCLSCYNNYWNKFSFAGKRKKIRYKRR